MRHDLDSLVQVVFFMDNKQIKTETTHALETQQPDFSQLVKELNNEPKSLVSVLNCNAYALHTCVEHTVREEPYRAMIKRVEQVYHH